MDYKKIYDEKLVSAKEAAGLIKSGDWIDFGWSAAMPHAVDKELAKRAGELEDINFFAGLAFKELDVLKDESGAFTWNSWHAGGLERRAINNTDRAFYIPLRYSELPRWYRENVDLDVAVLVTTPMDQHGYFNFGLNASHGMAAVESADLVIVEVNENMPYCQGGFEHSIHIDNVDKIVEGENEGMALLGSSESTDVDKKVAETILDMIPNGACLQLGIGGMPNAVGAMIADSDLKDLGVHSEMYVDAFVEMAKKGKITGAKKNIDRFRQSYAFAAGSAELYEYLDNNPETMAAPVDYTNSAAIVAQLDNFISINNALNVNLWGEVSSETTGYKHISGAGGQLDFTVGAYLSEGGKGIICLSSTFTDKSGKVHSRIEPTFKEGTVITLPRPLPHYIITEYGKLNLKGLSTWQRAEGIINLAHPDFRDDLIKSAQEMNIWRQSNKK